MGLVERSGNEWRGFHWLAELAIRFRGGIMKGHQIGWLLDDVVLYAMPDPPKGGYKIWRDPHKGGALMAERREAA